MMPTQSWIGNAMEVFDNYSRARDALHRKESEAKALGRTAFSVTATNSEDGGYANWNLNKTMGVKWSYDGEWLLWWIREVEFGSLSDP
jgi:hypothetical protein